MTDPISQVETARDLLNEAVDGLKKIEADTQSEMEADIDYWKTRCLQAEELYRWAVGL